MAEKVDTQSRARDWYIANPLATLRDVSEEFDVPYETIRDWSKNQGWYSQRILKGQIDDDQILLQAAGMRNVLYEKVVAGDLAAREETELVKAWLSLLRVRQPAETEETFDRDSLLTT